MPKPSSRPVIIRDFDAVPYRRTPAYKAALDEATRQRARLKFRVQELWAYNVGNSTSGMLRRPTGAMG
jgi:hypothetical protein